MPRAARAAAVYADTTPPPSSQLAPPPPVQPPPPLVPPSHERLVRYCVYEIVQAHASPPVDFRKTLAHSLLPKWFAAVFTAWQRRYMAFAGVLFGIAPFVTCAILFVRAPLGRQLSVLSFLLQTPLVVLGGMALRTDIVKLLLWTFEFWFFSFANTSTCFVMAFYYGDLRALYLVPIWLSVEFNICIDASVRGYRLLIASLAIGTIYHVLAVAMVAFEAIPDVQTFQVSNYGPRALGASDFLVNMINIVLYMLVRALYRRSGLRCRLRCIGSWPGHPENETQTRTQIPIQRGIHIVRCVSYRCGVRLQPKTKAVIANGDVQPSTATSDQLHYVPLGRVFDSSETLLYGRNKTNHRLPLWQRVAIHVVGGIGLALTGIMFLVLSYVPEYPMVAKLAAIAAPVFTITFCLVCVSLYHPGLLKQLCFSVDFAFMAVQFLFAHICAAYVCQWDHRAFVFLASFCWVVLMLTIDALTPVARHKIGFQLRFLVPFVCASITAHVLIANAVATGDPIWRLQDHVIFRIRGFGQAFDVHVMPAFFNRVWMLVLWELRVLWRILKSSRHSLVMIHGVVDMEITTGRRQAIGCTESAATARVLAGHPLAKLPGSSKKYQLAI